MTVHAITPAIDYDDTPLPGLSEAETELLDVHLDVAAKNLREWDGTPQWGDPEAAESLSGAFLNLAFAGCLLGVSYVSELAAGRRLRGKEMKLREREIELRHRELDLLEAQLAANEA